MSGHDEAPDPWAETMEGGRRFGFWTRFLGIVAVLGLVGMTAATTTGLLIVQQAEASLTRVPVTHLDDVEERERPRHFLLVGSDDRDGLSEDERSQLSLGDFQGQHSDTIIYVSISQDRQNVSLVSLPRDLLVYQEGRRAKLTDTFAGGADALIQAIQRNFGLPVHHYGAISLGGFTQVVRTLGTVHICLDEPLDDWRAGADFDAGCHDMGPEEALAYVRSRQGARVDFERIDRQQRFLRAVLSELVDTQLLTDPRRLIRLVEDVASQVTTDEDLSIAEMGRLADEMRSVVRDGLPMTTVPGYTRTIDGISYVIAYEPGARAIFDQLRAGEPITDRGTPEQRAETRVALWSGGRGPATQIVSDTLVYAGFTTRASGQGPQDAHATATTRVFSLPGFEQQAEWVSATLGVSAEPLPAEVSTPGNVQVVVAIGDDAAP